MPRINFSSAPIHRVNKYLHGILLACLIFPTSVFSAQQEDLAGFYSRNGNNGSPAKTAGNNIYIKFYQDRWIGTLFIPYPYAIGVEASVVSRVFDEARKRTTRAALMRGKFGQLAEAATIQIERYGYLEDRIVFECGSLSPCTIKLADGYLELIKPGVINEHIIKYNHVAAP